MRTLWMEVDLDHNELPIRVCDSCKELAKECGVSERTIYVSDYRVKKGISKGRYIGVKVEE